MPVTRLISFSTTINSTITNNNNTELANQAPLSDIRIQNVGQRNGLQSCFYGRQVEHPEMLEAMITWSDEKQSAAATLDDRITKRSSGSARMHHVDFSPYAEFTKAVAAPVTEVAMLYYAGTPPADCMDGLGEMRQVFVKHQIPGWRALAGGITHEDAEYGGVKGRAVVLVIGWQSIQQHMAWRATQLYADTLHLWPRGAKKLEMHHTAFHPDLRTFGDNDLHILNRH